MKNRLLETTIIGSYPVKLSNTELMRHYQNCMEGGDDFQILREAVDEQLRAGIDMVSDGQTRDGMIEFFVRNLGGTRLHGRALIMGDIYHKTPMLLGDMQMARKMLPDGKRLKAVLTGPFTLASACVDNNYANVEEATFAFARALREEARIIQPVVDVIQVDEPFFADDYPEYARDGVEVITDGLEVETALHVCGDVSNIFGELIEFNVDILEHEFAVNPGLLDIIKDYDFHQRIGYGSVRSDYEGVEEVGCIVDHVRRALEVFPPEKLVICTDCGLRHQPREAAFQKLRNMTTARKILLEEIA